MAMISKELKKLSRRELVDIIYQMKKNEEQLQEQIGSLQEELQDKRIRLANAGSIAEAAASITDLLTAAQNTADLYLQEIAALKADTQKQCKEALEEAQKNASRLMTEREVQCASMKIRYEMECDKLEKIREEIRQLEAVKRGYEGT